MKQAIANALEAGWLGNDIQGSGKSFCAHRAHRRRRLYLRRRNRDARKPRRQARHGAAEAADPGARGPVRQADRHQQCADLRGDARRSSPRAPPSTRISAWAARAAPCPSSSPATSSRAALSRRPSASPCANSSMISAAARIPAARCAPFRSAVRSGSYLPEAQFDLPMDYETFAANGAMVGHGGIVVFDDTVDMAKQARFAMEFCAIESCGKCTPCRIGSTRGVEVIDRIIAGIERDKNLVAARRSLPDHDRRLALRHGRPDADAGAERRQAFPRRFRPATRRRPQNEDSEMHDASSRKPTTARPSRNRPRW